jgi:hypothetical protein
MTVGGTRAKSWEFDDSGCIARLPGVLLRTPACARNSSPSRRGRTDWLMQVQNSPRGAGPKIPFVARQRRSPQHHRCPLTRIDICIGAIFPAPVIASLFILIAPQKGHRQRDQLRTGRQATASVSKQRVYSCKCINVVSELFDDADETRTALPLPIKIDVVDSKSTLTSTARLHALTAGMMTIAGQMVIVAVPDIGWVVADLISFDH